MSLDDKWEWDEGDPEEIYFLEEEIASGTFGSVYKAIHNKTGEIAALKITQPEEDDDLSQLVELWILKNCDCPNIAKLYGTWRRGDETFVCSSLCLTWPWRVMLGAISQVPSCLLPSCLCLFGFPHFPPSRPLGVCYALTFADG